MSTPYSSGFIGGKIPPLRFWTHKILPLVYEESLSYYEVLCKVAQKLNETIESVNLSTEEVTHIREIVDGLRDTIDAINEGMVKSVNGKYPDADGRVIVDAPSVPLNPPLIIGGQNRNYLQEAISALIMVYGEIDDELQEYMRNSAPYLVQIVNVGGTPELSVAGADYDEMVQNVSEHGKTILVSFPDDEYVYNGEGYRMYPQIGKLITNSVLEVSRIVSIAGGFLYEQYRFDRDGYISYTRHTHPELPIVPNENGDYALIRTANGLSWSSVSDTIADVETLNQYWKPTVLSITYTPSNGSANPIYSVAGFHELVPADEGAIIVEIRVAGQAPVHVQGYYVPGDAEHFPYVHAVIHERVDTKNILRVLLLYPQYVNVLDYDLEILKKAVLTVNGLAPNSAGAVSVDATHINMDATPTSATVHDEITEIGTRVTNNMLLGKELYDILYGAPQDAQRYKLTATYDDTVGMSIPQWMLDTAIDILNQYWKPTVLPVTYAPSTGSASPVYSAQEFTESLPANEGVVLVEIRTVGNTVPARVQGYYMPTNGTNEAYVHAIVHDKVGTKNVLRVYFLYATSVNVVTYDLDILNRAIQTVNGQHGDSNGAVTIDGTVIMLGATPSPISIQNKIAQMDTVISSNDTDIKGVLNMLNSVPLDGQRYKLTARYVQNSTEPTFQWVLDT